MRIYHPALDKMMSEQLNTITHTPNCADVRLRQRSARAIYTHATIDSIQTSLPVRFNCDIVHTPCGENYG